MRARRYTGTPSFSYRYTCAWRRVGLFSGRAGVALDCFLVVRGVALDCFRILAGVVSDCFRIERASYRTVFWIPAGAVSDCFQVVSGRFRSFQVVFGSSGRRIGLFSGRFGSFSGRGFDKNRDNSARQGS